MKTITGVTLYRCDHCNKAYRHKGHARKHEERCSSNPENQSACLGCPYLQKRQITYQHERVYYDYLFNHCKIFVRKVINILLTLKRGVRTIPRYFLGFANTHCRHGDLLYLFCTVKNRFDTILIRLCFWVHHKHLFDGAKECV